MYLGNELSLALEILEVHAQQPLQLLRPLRDHLDHALHLERENNPHAQKPNVSLIEHGHNIAHRNTNEHVEQNDDHEHQERQQNEPVEGEVLFVHVEVVVDVEVAEGHAHHFDDLLVRYMYFSN